MKKKSVKRERKNVPNMVKCVECANHYGEVRNYMVYCKKLGFYRSLAARICEYFVELKKQN